MKKLFISTSILLFSFSAFGQIIPKVNFGLKGGMNVSKLNTKELFSSDNKAGYFGGVWLRVGGAGIHFQPELYVSGKSSNLKSNTGETNKVTFTSLDLPLLVGTKFGILGTGFRVNTGPVVSFIIDDKQSFSDASSQVFKGKFKGQNFAWQFGAGFDISKFSIDARYELGLSNISKDGYPSTKLNLFMIGVGYQIF